MANENITVGTMAIARVGRNAIEVEVIAQADGGAYLVRNRNGKEFIARRLEPLPDAASPAEPAQPDKKPSLMNAAVEVLRRSEHPLSVREIVAQAVTAGLWTPIGAKTPEQTLYGTIFREIATKKQPRIVKAEQKGKFRLA